MTKKDDKNRSDWDAENALASLYALVGMTPMGMEATDIAYMFCSLRLDGSALSETYGGTLGVLDWEREALRLLMESIPTATDDPGCTEVKLACSTPKQAFEHLVDSMTRSLACPTVSFAGAIRIVRGDGTGLVMAFNHHGSQHFTRLRGWMESRSLTVAPEELH